VQRLEKHGTLLETHGTITVGKYFPRRQFPQPQDHKRKKFKPPAKNCECDIANTPYLKVVGILFLAELKT